MYLLCGLSSEEMGSTIGFWCPRVGVPPELRLTLGSGAARSIVGDQTQSVPYHALVVMRATDEERVEVHGDESGNRTHGRKLRLLGVRTVSDVRGVRDRSRREGHSEVPSVIAWLLPAGVAWELPRQLLSYTCLTTPEGIEQLMSSDVPQTVCFPAVATAYRLVMDLLKEAP